MQFQINQLPEDTTANLNIAKVGKRITIKHFL